MKKSSLSSIAGLLVISMITMIACSTSDDKGSPTGPAGSAADLAQYAQMENGSVIVGSGQLNWLFSGGSYSWMYAEVNQQNGIGLAPGEGQVDVTLQNVEFRFTNLAAGVSDIIVGILERDSDPATYTEIGQYPVTDGVANVPVAYHHLISYFGSTHYAIWFRALDFPHGMTGASLELTGEMYHGPQISLSQPIICPEPEPEPVASPVVLPIPSESRSTGPLNLCRNPFGAFCGGGSSVYTETFTPSIESNDIIAAGGARWCFDAGETLTRTGGVRPLRLSWSYSGGSTTTLIQTTGVTGPTCVTLSLPDPDRILTGMLFWVAGAASDGDTRYVTNATTEIVWP